MKAAHAVRSYDTTLILPALKTELADVGTTFRRWCRQCRCVLRGCRANELFSCEQLSGRLPRSNNNKACVPCGRKGRRAWHRAQRQSGGGWRRCSLSWKQAHALTTMYERGLSLSRPDGQVSPRLRLSSLMQDASPRTSRSRVAMLKQQALPSGSPALVTLFGCFAWETAQARYAAHSSRCPPCIDCSILGLACQLLQTLVIHSHKRV